MRALKWIFLWPFFLMGLVAFLLGSAAESIYEAIWSGLEAGFQWLQKYR